MSNLILEKKTTKLILEKNENNCFSLILQTPITNVGNGSNNDDKLNANDITETFVFQSLSPDFGVITRNVDFRITSVTAASGLTVSIFTSSDAAYTLGNTVFANDFLKVYGNIINKAATLKGNTL